MAVARYKAILRCCRPNHCRITVVTIPKSGHIPSLNRALPGHGANPPNHTLLPAPAFQ